MERVGQTLNRTGHHGSGNATDLTKQILADPRVASFIQEHSLSQDEIKRSLPKFNQFLVECRKVKEGDASYIAKGYEPILTMNEGYADVTYKETRQLKEQQEQQAIAKRINLVSLPQSYRKITFADIALDDVARVDTFESLVDFVANYPSPDQKGLYLSLIHIYDRGSCHLDTTRSSSRTTPNNHLNHKKKICGEIGIGIGNSCKASGTHGYSLKETYQKLLPDIESTDCLRVIHFQ